MYEVNYRGRTSYHFHCRIRPEGLLYDVERDLLAIAEFRVYVARPALRWWQDSRLVLSQDIHETAFLLSCSWSHAYSCFEIKTVFFKTESDFYTGCSRKNANSFEHDKFKTIRHRIALFASKCSEKTVVYQSTQNLCKFIKYLLLSSQVLTRHQWRHLHGTCDCWR